jgi:uncharacterized protein YodC (DUF2158 family)
MLKDVPEDSPAHVHIEMGPDRWVFGSVPLPHGVLREDFGRSVYPASDLVLVAPAYRWQKPPMIGDVVRLNSGSPPMLIVSADGDVRTCAWRHDDGLVSEFDFDYQALRPAGVQT